MTFQQEAFIFKTSGHLVFNCFDRKRYPKTNVFISTGTGRGARSVMDGFRWADHFLKRLYRRYGQHDVLRSMTDWKWDVTTCFSGIGCPEQALPLVPTKARHKDRNSYNCSVYSPPVSSPSWFSFHRPGLVLSDDGGEQGPFEAAPEAHGLGTDDPLVM